MSLLSPIWTGALLFAEGVFMGHGPRRMKQKGRPIGG
jgi:hypothetical protein